MMKRMTIEGWRHKITDIYNNLLYYISVHKITSGVYTISERGIKKIERMSKWEGKIGKSPTLSIIFTCAVKYITTMNIICQNSHQTQ